MKTATEARAEIAVIIVNYNAAELAIQAVESVLAQDCEGRNVEIHLVDNASPGSDATQFVRAHADLGWEGRVRLWLERENHGFGRGNNLVMESLARRPNPPSYVFLLNPDAKLENDVIGILSQVLESNLTASVAGAGISMPDGRHVTAAFRFPTMMRELASSIGFGPLERAFPSTRIPLHPDHEFGPVDWVAGAAVMMRFETLVDVGFFDPDFFLYYEEVELMWRIGKSGHAVLYVPCARVIHSEGASTGVRSDEAPRRLPPYVYQSWRLFYLKAHGRFYALSTAVLKLLVAVINLGLSHIGRGARRIAPGFFQDHWKYALRPLLLGSTD